MRSKVCVCKIQSRIRAPSHVEVIANETLTITTVSVRTKALNSKSFVRVHRPFVRDGYALLMFPNKDETGAQCFSGASVVFNGKLKVDNAT